jgi:hypothetical protein
MNLISDKLEKEAKTSNVSSVKEPIVLEIVENTQTMATTKLVNSTSSASTTKMGSTIIGQTSRVTFNSMATTPGTMIATTPAKNSSGNNSGQYILAFILIVLPWSLFYAVMK